MSRSCPEFTKDHDAAENYHAVREIILGGSLAWAGANARFQPKPGTRVMDVGANAGIYSAFCAIRGAHVTAYEPFRSVFALFSAMITKTGLMDRINAINAAIWTHTGKCSYLGNIACLDGACKTYNGGLEVIGVPWVEQDTKNSEEVDCISFDNAVGDSEWDCIKMDIEGAEYEVLLSASDSAFRRVRFMYVEFHPWAPETIYNQTIHRLCNLFCFEGVPSGYSDRLEAAYLSQR